MTMPQFPSLPETAHLTDLLVRFPKNVRPLMGYINAVLRSDGQLSIAERELIAAYVSALNACRFCFGSHEIYARAFGVEAGVVESLLKDISTAKVDDRLKPIFAYVKELNSLPCRLTPAHAQAVWDAGHDETALFEAVEVAGVFNLMNRMIEGGGVNFDYAAEPEKHTIAAGDAEAMANSYLRYADRIEALVAQKP
ncbi:MAG: carboxymuconolactone decarboxylase family protein [Pseudomonadota bacterium]